jgi:hypothetical protein
MVPTDAVMNAQTFDWPQRCHRVARDHSTIDIRIALWRDFRSPGREWWRQEHLRQTVLTLGGNFPHLLSRLSFAAIVASCNELMRRTRSTGVLVTRRLSPLQGLIIAWRLELKTLFREPQNICVTDRILR